MESGAETRDNHISSEDDSTGAPLERWAPLGAVADSPSFPVTESKLEYDEPHQYEFDVLRDENEKMANSLLSLTSHFAQVQFRLKQIVEGPDEMKSERLKELESFAERGIPDIKSCVVPTSDVESGQEDVDDEYKKRLSDKQREMISELKTQLSELESYAYESGVADEIPTSKMMEKQEIIIEEIKRKLQISHLDNLAALSEDELKGSVEEAIAQIVNPVKVKEKQLEQLKTQVNDLERFVDFLQDEVTNAKKDTGSAFMSSSPSSKTSRGFVSPESVFTSGSGSSGGSGPLPTRVRTQGTGSSDKSNAEESESRSSRIKQMMSIVHLFILREFGCASKQRERHANEMKSRTTEPHYGDMLAEMQMAIDTLADTVEKVRRDQDDAVFADCDYLSDEETYIAESKELTQCVRRQFAPCLRKLLEHGCVERSSSGALIPFSGCASRNSTVVKSAPVHAWTVIVRYYEVKDGKTFNETPIRKLADSFGLEPPGDTESTVKQTLLSAIGHVIDTHTPYHRSEDAHFKAFISLALNAKTLVPWLRQILRTPAIVDQFYEPWSCIVKTNFEDVFCGMNKLRLLEFNLPVDLAVKQLSNIKDAF